MSELFKFRTNSFSKLFSFPKGHSSFNYEFNISDFTTEIDYTNEINRCLQNTEKDLFKYTSNAVFFDKAADLLETENLLHKKTHRYKKTKDVSEKGDHVSFIDLVDPPGVLSYEEVPEGKEKRAYGGNYFYFGEVNKKMVKHEFNFKRLVYGNYYISYAGIDIYEAQDQVLEAIKTFAANHDGSRIGLQLRYGGGSLYLFHKLRNAK